MPAKPALWMRFSILLALLLWVGVASAQTYTSNGFQFSFAPVPDWIEPLPEVTQAVTASGSVDYLAVVRQANLTLPQPQYYYRQRSRANNLEGLETLSRIQASFNPAYEQLIWHQLDVIRDGQRLSRLAADEISLIREESELDQELFIGRVTSLQYVKDTRVGDIVEYSYSVVGRNPIFNQHIFHQSSLSWSVPVAQLYSRFLLPKGRDYQWQSTTQQAPEIIEQPTAMEYRWGPYTSRAIYDEEEYPHWHIPYDYFQLSEFSDWRQVSDWAQPLYQQRQYQHPELVALQQRLQDLPKSEAVVEALFYVQSQIRYVGIELGENSHLPRDPDTVMANRYGDCKDKSLLLVSLLQSIGIDAYPALVSVELGQKIADFIPSPGAFDHVITLVELDGQRYWLDPTRRFQAGSLETLGYYDYGQALVVAHPSDTLLALELGPEAESLMQVHETLIIADESLPVDYHIRSEYSGLEADRMRRNLASQALQTTAQDYLNYMQKLYSHARIERVGPLQVEDDQARNRIYTYESYRLRDGLVLDNGRWHIQFYGYTLSDYIKLPRVVARKSPLAVPNRLKVMHKMSLQYPEFLNMGRLTNFEPEAVGPVSYYFREDYLNRRVEVEQAIHFKQGAVKPSQMSAYQQLIKNIEDHWSPSYSTSYSEPEPGTRELGGLLDALVPLAQEEVAP